MDRGRVDGGFDDRRGRRGMPRVGGTTIPPRPTADGDQRGARGAPPAAGGDRRTVPLRPAACRHAAARRRRQP